MIDGISKNKKTDKIKKSDIKIKDNYIKCVMDELKIMDIESARVILSQMEERLKT